MTVDEEFMRAAIEEAKKSVGQMCVGAVIVKDGKIISRAYSTTYTEKNGLRHDEIKVVDAAIGILGTKHLPDCTLYTTVEPCMMCTGAALWEKVRRIVYGMKREDSEKYFEYTKHWYSNIGELLPADCEVISGILREECKKVFSGNNK